MSYTTRTPQSINCAKNKSNKYDKSALLARQASVRAQTRLPQFCYLTVFQKDPYFAIHQTSSNNNDNLIVVNIITQRYQLNGVEIDYENAYNLVNNFMQLFYRKTAHMQINQSLAPIDQYNIAIPFETMTVTYDDKTEVIQPNFVSMEKKKGDININITIDLNNALDIMYRFITSFVNKHTKSC